MSQYLLKGVFSRARYNFLHLYKNAIEFFAPVPAGVTATGTNQATSLATTTAMVHVTSAALSTGISIIAAAKGVPVLVVNDGANPIKVYGVIGGTDTIDGVAGSTGATVTNAKRALFFPLADGTGYLSFGGGESA